MKKQAKLLIIFNILFYIFIFIHRYYVYDYMPQTLFYMALFFSSIFLEEALKSKQKKVQVYLLADFLFRISVLILHFITIVFAIDLFSINLTTFILLIINILLETIVLIKVKDIKEDKAKTVKREDINKFIEDVKSRRLEYYILGADLKNEIEVMINAIETSGKSTIVIIILCVLVFISSFIYENFLQFIFVPILIIVFLLYILYKLSFNIIKIAYGENKDMSKKNLIDILTFIIGYVVLYSAEVIFYGKTGYFDVSLRVVAIIFFIPIFKTKFIIKEKFENTYIKYKEYIEDVV